MTEDEKSWAKRCAAQPGADWRVLAHKNSEKVEVENVGVLDEVAVGHWFHLEEMSERVWWARLGDARLVITIEVSGSVKVDIARGVYEAVDGETIVPPRA